MEPKIFNLNRIKAVLKDLDTVRAMEEGFVAYSQGKAVFLPVPSQTLFLNLNLPLRFYNRVQQPATHRKQ